jgi:hypothetical protein
MNDWLFQAKGISTACYAAAGRHHDLFKIEKDEVNTYIVILIIMIIIYCYLYFIRKIK